MSQSAGDGKLQRMLFVWTVRTPSQLYAMKDLLVQAARCPNVELKLYITRMKDGVAHGSRVGDKAVLELPPHVGEPTPERTLFESMVSDAFAGRPEYSGVFSEMVYEKGAVGNGVAVLTCGPQGMVDACQANARRFGAHVHKETFLF